MFSQPAVFVDVETNGQMGERGRIIEVGILRVEDGEVVETFESLVNPGSPVPHWIEDLTGIKNADLIGAPSFEDIADEIARITEGAIFVAHNVRFDYSFFRSHFLSLGRRFQPKLICTVRLSRHLYPNHRGHSLEKIIKRHGIKVASRHRALDDARAAYEFARIARSEKGPLLFDESVVHQLKTKSLPPHVPETMINNLPASPGVYIFHDADGSPLYVGKSINIRQRVRSHFANDTRIVKEMKLSQRSFSVSHIETATEVEALLLESAKVKELQPTFNRLLRRAKKQAILLHSINEAGYSTIDIDFRDVDSLADLEQVYGVYTSRTKAKSALESVVKTYQLCSKLVSLESGPGACFRHQLGQCRGACIGQESPAAYNRRVETALAYSKIASWPFSGRIAVTISPSRSLVVNQWIVEGVINHELDEVFEPAANRFDIDTYKILRSFVRQHPESVRRLPEGYTLE